jgi:hypothetical protein
MASETDALSYSQEMKHLEVSLRTEPFKWVKEFVAEGGCSLLVEAIRKYSLIKNATFIEYETQINTIRAWKAFLNNGFGLDAMVRFPDGIATFGLAYGAPSIKMKTLV